VLGIEGIPLKKVDIVSTGESEKEKVETAEEILFIRCAISKRESVCIPTSA